MYPTFKQYLAEKEATGFFVFGRFNPPTAGHEKLLDKLAEVSRGSDYRVFVSRSSDAKKNPLRYDDKVKFMRKLFPRHARSVIKTKNVNSVLDVAVHMSESGYQHLIMVAGEDRVDEFNQLLNKYNGVDSRHGKYEFKSIKVISAGSRDPDSSDIDGMSATKLRDAAKDNDFIKFAQGLPKGATDQLSKEIFNAVRKGMNLTEKKSFAKHVTLNTCEIREAFHSGEIFNIGDKVIFEGNQYEIVFRGTNHVTISFEDFRKNVWLDQIEPVTEKVSDNQIDDLERFADKLLAKYDIDIEFTKHFADRMNDARNNPDIKVAELQKFFKKIKKSKGNKIKSMEDMQAVLKDISAMLNIPVVIRPKDNGDFEVTLKTIMRKKNFKTPNKVIQYEARDVEQDDDIEDRKGTQPKKYFKDLKKSTKVKRDQHFKKNAKKDDDDADAYDPAPGDADAITKPSKHTMKFKQMFGEDADKGLKAKAEKSGVSLSILKQVYNRGMAAWKSGHRPGTTPQQWGMARVNSFLTGGKTRTTADADLWAKTKKK